MKKSWNWNLIQNPESLGPQNLLGLGFVGVVHSCVVEQLSAEHGTLLPESGPCGTVDALVATVGADIPMLLFLDP